jgi:hypothetical protein
MEHIPAPWNKRELNGWLLGSHPSLPVVEIKSLNSMNLGWLVGYPIDENSEILKGVAIYNKNLERDNLSDFESWLYKLGGTFVAILITPYGSRFYLDAAGTLPAVFHPGFKIVGSTPTLISEAEDDEPLINIMGISENDHWYPFGLTPKKSVERLIPNHYLNLETWVLHRHWPKEKQFAITQDIETAVREIASIITRNIAGVAKVYPTYMALTAGRDTRMMLACAKDSVENITFYTWQTPDNLGTLDCTVVSEMAQHFNLKHEIVQHQSSTKQQQQDWLEQTGYCVGGRVYVSFATNYQLKPESAIIGGKGGETGRAYYYNRAKGTSDTKLTGEKILSILKLPQTPHTVNRANKWLQSLSSYDVLTILDLLYIEQRLGCWGSIPLYGNNWNIFETQPICHRRIFELILGLPPDYRIKENLSRDLIKTQWPELLKFPFNNYRGIRGFKKNIKKHPIAKSLKNLLKSVRKIPSKWISQS